MWNVLLIGSGGREDAVARAISQSPKLGSFSATPGNPGIARWADCIPSQIPNLDAKSDEIAAYLDFVTNLAEDRKSDLTLILREDLLAWGLSDQLRAQGRAVFGASSQAAQLEASKILGKELSLEAHVPQGPFWIFDNWRLASKFVCNYQGRYVIKKDGLAAGKGVWLPEEKIEAVNILWDLIVAERGSALIEAKLEGPEISIHALTDGKTIRHFPLSRDWKRALDSDLGKNTGGMGSQSPVPEVKWNEERGIRRASSERMLSYLQRIGIGSLGSAIFPGGMRTKSGLMILEHNMRLGDPETQVIIPRMLTDPLEVFMAAATGSLDEIDLRWSRLHAVAVVLAAEGYPEKPDTGHLLSDLRDLDPKLLVFHSGTKLEDGKLYSAGGRVLTLVGLGKNSEEARGLVYQEIPKLNPKASRLHYRRDIAQ